MREIEKMERFYKWKAAGKLWWWWSSSQIPTIACRLGAPCVNASPTQGKQTKRSLGN